MLDIESLLQQKVVTDSGETNRIAKMRHMDGSLHVVRITHEYPDRYVVRRIRPVGLYIDTMLKSEWRITGLNSQTRAALAILLCGLVVAAAGLAILYANTK